MKMNPWSEQESSRSSLGKNDVDANLKEKGSKSRKLKQKWSVESHFGINSKSETSEAPGTVGS